MKAVFNKVHCKAIGLKLLFNSLNKCHNTVWHLQNRALARL